MIPATAHFIWIGTEFPWLNYAAIASALANGGFSRVVLHHTHDLSGATWWRALARHPAVERRRIIPEEVLRRVGCHGLVELYRELSAPAALTNMLRLTVLLEEGGVYLDLDTVTARSLSALREASFFCGAERIAFPASLERTRNPARWGAAFLRTGVRDVARRSAHGVHWFRKLEHLYPAAANNAVIGAERGHPFLAELLRRVASMPRKHALQRYALGTSLLQHALGEIDSNALVVHAPEVFYPLGPELSQHWFRLNCRARLDDVLRPATRVVHWYASVRTRHLIPEITPLWVERNRDRQLLSALLFNALEKEFRSVGEPSA
ncbi:MAG TPA: glycosyltransferase [Polyangiaceae bacterium]|nr:glycosyltransferase [Polyangiaceae bacterium]